MHSNSHRPDGPKDDRSNKESDSDRVKSGFLILQVRRGEEIEIGDIVIGFNEISSGYARVAIKAPKAIRIHRR